MELFEGNRSIVSDRHWPRGKDNDQDLDEHSCSRRAFLLLGLLSFLVSFDFGEIEAKVTHVV